MMRLISMLAVVFIALCVSLTAAFSAVANLQIQRQSSTQRYASTISTDQAQKIVIIGAGWAGLSAAHALSKSNKDLQITIVDAASRVGGLVRDGFPTINGTAQGEAGQHGFWDNYHNIFALLDELFDDVDDVLTGYAEQGQYSPSGLEAVWPVYRDNPRLPTGLAQALYTKFVNLSPLDRASALPMALAFSDFDDSEAAWDKYDKVSFRDLCVKLGVSKKCYDEIFEPMILTGLFAPGAECSAAAALGMAYFFVLKSQNSFDVRWCKGNIGKLIFDPWVELLKESGVQFQLGSRVTGFECLAGNEISKVICSTHTQDGSDTKECILEANSVIFAVGGAALNSMVRGSPELSKHFEFRKFSNLRGTGVLATRLYLDTVLDTPYSANACWGFDEGVGMTMFDITKLHDVEAESKGSIIELDYYHAASLLVMPDEQIVQKAKNDLDTIISQSRNAKVLDAALVRLPQAVNWYSPGSYANMPNAQSISIPNVYFCGDIVRSRHGSWSQEKAYVTGLKVANKILGRRDGFGVVPLEADEPHVKFGRGAFSAAKSLLRLGGFDKEPSIVDFFW